MEEKFEETNELNTEEKTMSGSLAEENSPVPETEETENITRELQIRTRNIAKKNQKIEDKIKEIKGQIIKTNSVTNLYRESKKLITGLGLKYEGLGDGQIADINDERNSIEKKLSKVESKVLGIKVQDLKPDEIQNLENMVNKASEVDQIDFKDFNDKIDNLKSSMTSSAKKTLFNYSTERAIFEYKNEIKRLKEKKLGFLAILNGKQKLNRVQIENLQSKIDLLVQMSAKKNSYSVRDDILAQLKMCEMSIKEIEGEEFCKQNLLKTQNLYDNIKNNFSVDSYAIDDNVIVAKAIGIMNGGMPLAKIEQDREKPKINSEVRYLKTQTRIINGRTKQYENIEPEKEKHTLLDNQYQQFSEFYTELSKINVVLTRITGSEEFKEFENKENEKSDNDLNNNVNFESLKNYEPNDTTKTAENFENTENPNMAKVDDSQLQNSNSAEVDDTQISSSVKIEPNER